MSWIESILSKSNRVLSWVGLFFVEAAWVRNRIKCIIYHNRISRHSAAFTFWKLISLNQFLEITIGVWLIFKWWVDSKLRVFFIQVMNCIESAHGKQLDCELNWSNSRVVYLIHELNRFQSSARWVDSNHIKWSRINSDHKDAFEKHYFWLFLAFFSGFSECLLQ